MGYDIGPRIGIEGEAEFRQAIQGINTNLKTLGTEMQAVTSQFDKGDKSQAALTAQNEVLNKQIAEQKSKLEQLNAGLAQATEKYGAADKTTQGWQQAVNKATADLNNMERQVKDNNATMEEEAKQANNAGDELESAGKKAKLSGDNADEGKSKWEKLGSVLGGIGKVAVTAVAALGTATVAAATGVTAMTAKAAANADEINTIATQTGLSTEQIQKFQFATEQIDVPLDTLTGSMAKLTKNMATAQGGTGSAAEAFKALGISVTDSNGEMRNNQDVFNDAIGALGQMENSTQRDALAMQIFGKSAQELNPLILGGADTLKKLGDQAEESGLILGQDALNNLNKFQDAIDTFKGTIGSSGNLFATAFAGPLADGVNTATGYMQDLAKAFNSVGGGMAGFQALSGEIGNILNDVGVKINEYLPKILDFGLNIITTLVDGISQNVPALVQSATTILDMLLKSLLEMLPTLLEAGVQVIVQLANGIAQSLPTLIPTIVETITTIVTMLIDNVDSLVDASVAIITALAEGLINSLPVLLEKAPVIIAKLVVAIIRNAPKLLTAAAKIVYELVIGLATIPAKMLAIGGNLISGLWNGISNKLAWLKQKIAGFAQSVISSIKSFFGVHSPSTVMEGIGGYLSEGLANGISNKSGLVSGAMNRLNNDLAASANVTVSGGISGGGYGVAVSNVYMDSVLVASASGKAQYRKNATRSRSYGVVPA